MNYVHTCLNPEVDQQFYTCLVSLLGIQQVTVNKRKYAWQSSSANFWKYVPVLSIGVLLYKKVAILAWRLIQV